MAADLLSLLTSQFNGNQLVLTGSNRAVSLSQLRNICEGIANELKNINVQTLALLADNGIEWLMVDLACQIADVRFLPLPTFFSPSQLLHAFNAASVDTLVTNANCAQLFLSGKAFEAWQLKDTGLALFKRDAETSKAQIPAQTGKITFTSGSTGNPKGVCLSNQQLIDQANALATRVAINGMRHLCILPLSTLLENVAGVYAPLLAGGEVIVPSMKALGYQSGMGIDPDKFTAVIDKYQPHSFILTPQLLQLLLSVIDRGWQIPACLRFVAVGGGKVSRTLLERAKLLNLPVFEGYGLSECASVVSLNTLENNKLGSVGKPLDTLDISFEDGEIMVSGNAMLGYLNEPQSWYPNKVATGDLGFQDEQGYLHINGRKSNLIISSFGRNINPEWLESEVLSEPNIRECVVFGDSEPYCVALVFATQVPHSSEKSQAQSVQQAIENANTRLPEYARIKRWIVLPAAMQTQNFYTSNGRPRRKAISEHYARLIETLYQESVTSLPEAVSDEMPDEIF